MACLLMAYSSLHSSTACLGLNAMTWRLTSGKCSDSRTSGHASRDSQIGKVHVAEDLARGRVRVDDLVLRIFMHLGFSGVTPVALMLNRGPLETEGG